MAIGRGKYDEEATKLLIEHCASLAVVMICDGSKGNGFSISINQTKCNAPDLLAMVAKTLREAASQIERDVTEWNPVHHEPFAE